MINPEYRPISSPTAPPNESALMASPTGLAPEDRVARWRWWVALVILVGLPLKASLASAHRRASAGADAALLPTSIAGLLVFCAMNLVEFGVVWSLAWGFSRASKDELLLRWKGWNSLLWGALYSILMRFGIVLVAAFILIALTIAGFDPKTMAKVVQSSGENVQKVFAPIFVGRDPLYKLLVIALISFVVAGLREELWRAATMAGISHLAPRKWSQNARNCLSLGLSSAFFGAGHAYQGAAGIFGTAILGVALGAILLRHKSVWPAIIAHGCFDAVSFAALAFGVGMK